MTVKIIGDDIKLMRARYDEALVQQGIACQYQFPYMADSNTQGEPLVEAYSEILGTNIFFDGNPKIKTLKRYGWVVENDANLPFLIHCSWNLPHVQKDAIFRIAGQYTEVPDRVFRVTELTYDIQCPDHLICQVIPAYDKKITGRTKEEVSRQFNRSNYFINQPVDYRGQYVVERKGDK